MEQTITLNEKDIAEIIAKNFDCDPKNVEVFTQLGYEGYGPMERITTRCRAKVTITKEVKTHA